MWTPANGQRVRFFTKLNGLSGNNLVLGAQFGKWPAFFLHSLAKNGPAPAQTLFEVNDVQPDGGFQLYLRHVPGTEDMKITWYWPDHCTLALNPAYLDSREQDVFRIDSLGDPWFALNNEGKSRVVDVYGSQTAENSQVDAWKWNEGDNQWWRVEIY